MATLFIAGSTDDTPVRERLAELSTMARQRGMTLRFVPHPYHLPQNDPLWAQWATWPGAVVLVTPLHPRPTRWLFENHAVALDQWEFVDLNSAAAVPDTARALDRFSEAGTLTVGDAQPGHAEPALEPVPLLPPRWYPVMDLSRCVHCGHCVQFCIFGVYTVEEGKVTVKQPDRCKAGCPACSRICPHGAIMFPLYAKDQRIAGAPGMLMMPDAAGRRLFYARTGNACPSCGQAGKEAADGHGVPEPVAEHPCCPECGRSLASSVAKPQVHADPDDLDRLIDNLEELARRRR